jgi:hypothetical protein
LSENPAGNEIVRKYASSTSISFSPVIEKVRLPLKYGSSLAYSVSSDSPRLKIRSNGPTWSPDGTKAALW